MPEPRHEHGSGVVAAGDYAPGSRLVVPAGYSSGIRSLPAEPSPPETDQDRAEQRSAVRRDQISRKRKPRAIEEAERRGQADQG